MDGQQYLNQISQTNRPVKQSGGGLNKILTSKIFIVVAIGLVLLILIMILGAVIGGGKKSVKELGYELTLHLDNTVAVIKEYQPNVKSSRLRANSASLDGVLSNTKSQVNTVLMDELGFNKKKDASDTAEEEAIAVGEELKNELFEAKINGILDRVYAHKMAYEISLFLAEEEQILENTSNENLINAINTSHESLTNLYDKFNNFSETDNSLGTQSTAQ